MLTCKIGNTIINCFNDKYDKYTLKQWSDKNKLICPDCSKPYEYCHGEVVPPYFRHKEKSKECEGIYFEPETEEHIKGKMILYNWLINLQEQNIVSNVKLESYIPETRQRPDLYFEKDNQRFVIEFQCSPIATEYLERHRLYELAMVNDIWIMGTDKYNNTLSERKICDMPIVNISLRRTIEKNANYRLDVYNNILYINCKMINNILPYKLLFEDYYDYCQGYNLENLVLINNNIFINNNILDKLKSYDIKVYEQNKYKIEEYNRKKDEEYKRQLELQNKRNNIISKTTLFLDNNNIKYEISYRDETIYYNLAICINIYYKQNNSKEYVFFIKDKIIDFCSTYTYSDWGYAYSQRKHKVTRRLFYKTGYNNIDKFESDNICDNDISNFIFNKIKDIGTLIYEDIKCVDCGKIFKLTFGEIMFFNNKKLEYPKRCKPCRDIRKQNRRI